MDCVFYEVFKEEKEFLKQFLPSHITAEFISQTIQEHGQPKPLSGLISIRTQSTIPGGWAKDLKGILARTTGYDHLTDYCKRTKVNIPCGYLPTYCSRAVAEQAMLLALGLFRKIKTQIRSFDVFNRDGLTGRECEGRNLLVIGVGNIGSQVVDIGKGFRMNVKGVDIDPKLKDIEYVAVTEGLSWADVIICALPLTLLTKDMLNYSAFKKVNPGTVFVNVGRGEVSPLEDLKRLLDENILGGLGLDVFEEESKISQYLRNKDTEIDKKTKIVLELKDKETCIFTPHNAFNTKEATKRKAKQAIEAIESFLKTKQFPGPIPEDK